MGRAARRGDDVDRSLRALYDDLDAGMTLIGRDANRLIADIEQARRYYGQQVPRRSEIPAAYDEALAKGASRPDAIRKVVRDCRAKTELRAKTEFEVRQAIDRRRKTPPPRRIKALYQVDANGEYQLIYEFSHGARDQQRDQ